MAAADLAMKGLAALGLVLLIGAYLANRRGAWDAWSGRYLGSNAVGAFLLAAYSVWIGEWIFVALEGFWAAVSVWPLVGRRRWGGDERTGTARPGARKR